MLAVKILSITGKLVCFMLLALATIILASCLSPAQQKVRDGDVSLGKMDWNNAVISYSEAVIMDPQLKLDKKIAGAYAGKGDETYKNHDYVSAAFNYGKAISFNPGIDVGLRFGHAQYEVGIQYLNQHKYQEAVVALTGAIKHGYANKNVYLSRARAYANEGLYSYAIADVSNFLDSDVQSAEAYEIRGHAYLATGEYGKAAADLSQAIELDPSAKEAYFDRGLVRRAMGEFTMAIADFRKVIDLDPSYVAAFVWLGRTYYSTMGYYAAIEQFSRAIDMDNKEAAVAYNDRAVCLGKIGRFNEAVADLDTLTGTNPAFYLAYYNRGVLYMKMVQPGRAIEELDIYLCLDIFDKFGCRGLAMGWRGYYTEYTMCCIRPGISERAISQCNRILSQRPGYDRLPYTEGSLYFVSERSDYAW